MKSQGSENPNPATPSIEEARTFTRGPWTAQRITVDGGVRFKINSPGKWIELASVYTNPFATTHDKGDGESNARLIAAAPVLYAALELWITKARFFAPNALEYDMAIDEARAALALANGQRDRMASLNQELQNQDQG